MGWRLIKGNVKANLKLVVGFGICLYVLSAASLFLLVTASTYLRTLEEDVRATFGGYAYRIGATTEAAQNLLLRVSGEENLVPVVYSSCMAVVERSAIKSDLLQVGNSFEYGKLISGRRSHGVSEVEVSRAIQIQSGVELGSSIECDGKTYEVVGVSVLPARIQEPYLVSNNPSVQDKIAVNDWVADADIGESVAYQSFFRRGDLRGFSADTAVRLAEESAARTIVNSWLLFARLMSVASGLLIVLSLFAFRKATQNLRQALGAAGFARWRASFVSLGPLIGFLICVILFGALSSFGLLYFAKSAIARKLDQFWETILFGDVANALIELIVLALTAVCIYLLTAWMKNRGKESGKLRSQGKYSPRTAFLVGVMLLVLGAMAIFFMGTDTAFLYYFAACSLSIGAALCGCVIVWLFYSNPLRRAGYRYGISALTLTPIIALICLMGTIASATLYMQQSADTLDRPNADSYLTVGFLTDSDLSYLQKRFPEMMQDAIVLGFPEKENSTIRVAQTDFKSCVQSVEDAAKCHQWIDLIGFVISQKGRELEGKISPELAAAQAGDEYDVVVYGTDLDRPEGFLPVVLNKKVDDNLGQAQLPGWVANPNDHVFVENGISVGLERRLYLPNFTHYPFDMQQQFRRAAQSISSNAALSESVTVSSRTLEVLSWWVLLFEAGFSLLLIYLGRVTSAQNGKEVFQTLSDYGASRGFLARLHFTQLAPYLLAVISGIGLGRMMLRPIVGGRGAPVEVSPGWIWITPGFAVMIISVFALIYWSFFSKGNRSSFIPNNSSRSVN